ncbi:MAG: helix-turn-helix transcriptional regulator [Oscillospiraceae bacterium]|nr:helix-turn-helix transcriptional regulator [Oscillospiraceae bacterium]
MAAEFFVTEANIVYKRTYPPGKSFRQTGRKEPGLVFVLSGELTLHQEDTCTRLPADSILLLQKQDKYRLMNEGTENAEYIVVSYQAEPEAQLLPYLPGQVFHSTRPSRFRDLFSALLKRRESHAPCAQARLCAAVQEILCRIIAEHYHRGVVTADNYADIAFAYMEAHLGENISSQDIANAAGISVSHLRSVFRQQYGNSLIRQLNSLRVEQAKLLLEEGMLTLAEIATACGFQNEYYFSRVFKQFTGISPGKY